MKTYLKRTSIIIFSLFCLTSCDNEPLSEDIELNNPTLPSGENVSESEILGTWEISDQVIIITQEINANIEGFPPINSTQTLTANQISGDATVTFAADGTYMSGGTITLEVTGEQDGVAIPDSETTQESGFNSGTWNITNGNLNLTADGTDFSYVITSFNTNNMVLFSNQELPGFGELLASEEIPDITNIPGFEDLPGFNFDVEQSFENEVSLTKVE